MDAIMQTHATSGNSDWHGCSILLLRAVSLYRAYQVRVWLVHMRVAARQRKRRLVLSPLRPSVLPFPSAMACLCPRRSLAVSVAYSRRGAPPSRFLWFDHAGKALYHVVHCLPI